MNNVTYLDKVKKTGFQVPEFIIHLHKLINEQRANHPEPETVYVRPLINDDDDFDGYMVSVWQAENQLSYICNDDYSIKLFSTVDEVFRLLDDNGVDMRMIDVHSRYVEIDW